MNIGIVGAGLVGQLLAFNLQRKGHNLSIFTNTNKQACGSATSAAAGILTPVIEMQKSEYIINALGLHSITLWKKILPSLTKKVFYQFNGSVLTAHLDDHAELDRFKKNIQSKLREYQFQELDSKSAKLFEPDLTLKNGLYFPMDAHIESRSLITALNYELENKHVKWYINTMVTKIEPFTVFVKNDKHAFDMVFDCRGYSAKDLFLDIRGVRGELLYLHAPEVNIKHPIRLLTPRYSIYVVPLPKQNYIVGASEIETEDDSPISVRTCLELLTTAYTLHTGFAESRILHSKVGLRPALPSNLPKIKHMPGLIAINGLYRHGFLIAPVMIDIALRLLEERKQHAFYPELIMEFNND